MQCPHPGRRIPASDRRLETRLDELDGPLEPRLDGGDRGRWIATHQEGGEEDPTGGGPARPRADRPTGERGGGGPAPAPPPHPRTRIWAGGGPPGAPGGGKPPKRPTPGSRAMTSSAPVVK